MTIRMLVMIAALAAGCGPQAVECDHGGSGGAGSGGTGGAGPIVCPPSECPGTTPGADKAACDDGDPGTVDRCFDVAPCGGFCVNVPGQCDGLDNIETQQARCDDGNECTADRCMSGVNVCEQVVRSDGVPCAGGTCKEGACTP